MEFGLSEDRFIVLMVSVLIPSKRVDAGIKAVSRIPDAHLAEKYRQFFTGVLSGHSGHRA